MMRKVHLLLVLLLEVRAEEGDYVRGLVRPQLARVARAHSAPKIWDLQLFSEMTL